MRTYARVDTKSKGLTCVNCDQKAYEMHNINDCVTALEVRKLALLASIEGLDHKVAGMQTRVLLEGRLPSKR